MGTLAILFRRLFPVRLVALIQGETFLHSGDRTGSIIRCHVQCLVLIIDRIVEPPGLSGGLVPPTVREELFRSSDARREGARGKQGNG